MSRGTSNSNDRGSSYQRRARREYLVETYRSDVDLLDYYGDGYFVREIEAGTDIKSWCLPVTARLTPTCRCYRCAKLLTVDTVTVDRIKPGCEGGTYRRSNIRPACSTCNEKTGGKLGAERKAKGRARK